jgi:hypothetical protein
LKNIFLSGYFNKVYLYVRQNILKMKKAALLLIVIFSAVLFASLCFKGSYPAASEADCWQKAALHAHSTVSDGTLAPEQVISEYKKRGYSVVAVSDHNRVFSCSKLSNDSDLLCIEAEEWGAKRHMLLLNLHAPPLPADSLNETAERAASLGAFVIPAHPGFSTIAWSEEEINSTPNITALEIFNAQHDSRPLYYWDLLLSAGKRIYGIADDDMHKINSIDSAHVEICMKNLSGEEFSSAFASGLFYSTTGVLMKEKFSAECGSSVYQMGSTANCSNPILKAVISASKKGSYLANVSIISNGIPVFSTGRCRSPCTILYNASESGYYRLEAADSLGKRLWSNPIWINQ